MLNLSHKNLDVWELGFKLVKMIYVLTEEFPSSEKFGLVAQLRRAAVSVVSNIAEGAARYSPAEKSRFFEIARSSLVEVDTQIELSIVLNILGRDEVESLTVISNELFAKLTNLKKSQFKKNN